MKSLTEFINEALNKRKVEAVLGQYNGKTITIIGKPFTSDRDERYTLAMEFAKKNGIKTGKTFGQTYKELGEKADEVEHWITIVNDEENKVYFVDFDDVTPDDEEEFAEYIKESKDNDVFAVVDFTDAIQGVFDTKEEAEEMIKGLPKESEAKVKKMKKSEVEEK